MHPLFAQVLSRRDLTRAGDLFSVPDSAISRDLSDALYCIADIASSPNYVRSENDQAVVEICITRVTAAIRDTASLDLHVKALVLLWKSCLHHSLSPGPNGEDPPHAKIASDIMSCLFMQHCSDHDVMKQVLSVAVRFLHQGNGEIINNVSRYLALATIENAKLLAYHSLEILDSIFRGNLSLACILPSIYAEDPEVIHERLDQLMKILPSSDEHEKSHLLQLVCLISKDHPELLNKHVPLLISQLRDPKTTSQTTLASLVAVAFHNPALFEESLPSLQNAIRRQPSLISMAVKIFGAVGRINKEMGRSCIAFLVYQLPSVDQTSLPAVLIEIKGIADQYEGLLDDYVNLISLQRQSQSTAARMIVQQLLNDMSHSHSSTKTNISLSSLEQRHTASDVEKVSVSNMSALSDPTHRQRYYKKRPPGRQTAEAVIGQSSQVTTLTAPSREPVNLNRVMYRKSSASSNRVPSSHLEVSSVKDSESLQNERIKVSSLPSQRTAFSDDERSIRSQTSHTAHRHLRGKMSPTDQYTNSDEDKRSIGQGQYDVQRGVIRKQPYIEQHVVFTDNEQTNGRRKEYNVGIKQKKSWVTQKVSSEDEHSISRHNHLHSSHGISRNNSNGKLSQASLQSFGSSTNRNISVSKYRNWENQKNRSQDGVNGSHRSLQERIDPPYPLRKGSSPVTIKVEKQIPQGSVQSNASRDSSVQRYLFRRQREICNFIDSIKMKIPIPDDCIAQGNAPGRVDFYCCQQSKHCLYSQRPFMMETKQLQPWIHLKFLHLQASSSSPVSLDDKAVQSLKEIWESYKKAEGNITFLKLITQNFPAQKVQQSLIQQLCNASYYDMFTYDTQLSCWTCFLCSNPSKLDALSGDQPLIEGQLKQRKVRWKLFRRWRTRYFTLAGERLFSDNNNKSAIPIEISKMQSVKTVGRRRDRTIPKAFEIFTEDHKTYIFKAKDGANAEQWVQCLTLAMRKGKSVCEDEESSTA